MVAPFRNVAIATLTLLVGCSGTNQASFQTSVWQPGQSPTGDTPSLGAVTKQLTAKPGATKNFLVVPGERVGPITRDTNWEALNTLFEESKLRDRTIWGAEGIGRFPATQVDLGPKRSFLIVWTNTTRSQPALIRDLGSDWKTAEGIGVGTPLKVLQQKLGNFQLFGLGWDYSGTVSLQGTKLPQYEGKLILQMQPMPNAAAKFPNDYQAVSGDRRFASTNPHWKPLGMRVGSMTVVLNGTP